jgi:uncharacterized protein (DUF1778 family)
MPPAEPKIPLTVYIPPALRHDVKAAAEALGQTLSKFVERTLTAALRSADAAKQ